MVSDQPTIATYRRASTTAGDHLTVHLPPLQSEWSVAVWATEAPNLVLSLLGADGSQALVQQTAVPSEQTGVTGGALSSAFAFSVGSPASGTAQVGEAARRNVVVPTQDLVVITRSNGRLTLHVARGMGPVETLETDDGFDFAPTELRFGTPGWDQVFEGSVHRVKVWDDAALDLPDVEVERVSILPAAVIGGGSGGGGGCGMIGIEGLVLVPLVPAWRRRFLRAVARVCNAPR